MDSKTLLLERYRIQDELSTVRAYSLATAKRRGPWWLSLPIFPVAAWVLTRGGSNGNGRGGHPHPIVKSFLMSALQKMVATIAKGAPSQPPSFFQRIFN